MNFFTKAWIRFAPAVGIALFFVPLLAQASTGGQACDCTGVRDFNHCAC